MLNRSGGGCLQPVKAHSHDYQVILIDWKMVPHSFGYWLSCSKAMAEEIGNQFAMHRNSSDPSQPYVGWVQDSLGFIWDMPLCYNSIPKWGLEYGSEGVRQLQVGTWLQLIVVPPRLYVSDCPSILESKVKGSEVGWGWAEIERFGSKFREVRNVSEMSVKADFQIRERRLCYISFILWSKISIRLGSV